MFAGKESETQMTSVASQTTRKPVQDTAAFTLTCPRANGELPWTQFSRRREPCSRPWDFEAKVDMHNKLYNKSGLMYKEAMRTSADICLFAC